MKIISIMVAIMFLPLVAALPSDAQLEKPNWSVGDYWEYSGTYAGTASMSVENATLTSTIDSTVSLRVHVNDVQVKQIKGEYVGCYILDVTSTISGTYTYELGQQHYSGNFAFNINGTSIFTTNTLAVVNTDISVGVDINIPNMPPSLSTETDYDPPFDFMQFPVSEGEKWTSSTTTTTSYMGGEPSTAQLSFSFECTGKSGDRYIIKTDYIPFIGDLIPINNTLILWSDSKGMIDEIRGQSPEQTLSIKLKDYKYEAKKNSPPNAKFSYTPSNPSVGSVVTFDASSSNDSDGNIAFYQWDFGDGIEGTGRVVTHQYGSNGKYTVTLTVLDNYGESDTYSKVIDVSGGGGGGGGSNSSPGFETAGIFLALLAAALILGRKKILHR